MTATTAKIDTQLAGLLKPRAAGQTPLGLQTILLFGKPGTAKTTIAAGFPNHLYLDLENSATNHSIMELFGAEKDADGNLVETFTWASFRSFVKDVLDGVIDLGDRRTLVIDTVNDLWHRCREHVFAQLGIKDAADGDWGKGFSAPRTEFKEVVEMLLACAKRGIMGTVFIAHEVEEESTAGNVKVMVAKPLLTDKELAPYMAAKPQMVLRTMVTDVHPRTKVPFLDTTAVPPVPKARWLLQAVPEVAGSVVKDRTRRLPAFMSASYEALAERYDKGQPESS